VKGERREESGERREKRKTYAHAYAYTAYLDTKGVVDPRVLEIMNQCSDKARQHVCTGEFVALRDVAAL
jgi:hypothetical protein